MLLIRLPQVGKGGGGRWLYCFPTTFLDPLCLLVWRHTATGKSLGSLVQITPVRNTKKPPKNLDMRMRVYFILLCLPTDKHPCQSTIRRTKTRLTGSSTGWQWTEWSHWGTYPPTGEPLAVMTSLVSTITKTTSVESLQTTTSLPSLVTVFALRPSLSTSVVTLEYTRLPGSGR